MKINLHALEQLVQKHHVALLWLGFATASIGLFVRTVVLGETPYVIQDFLVNYGDGIVRRGLGGEIVRLLADVFGGGPYFWAWAVLSLAAAALFVLAIRILRKLPSTGVMLPLILAPWGLMFYAFDPDGSFRKELFGFLAIGIVLQGALARSERAAVGWATAGGAVFVMFNFAHEAIVFLLPILAMSIWLLAVLFPGRRGVFVAVFIAAAVGAVAIVIYLSRLPLRDVAQICLSLELDSCGGPFGWLNASVAESWDYVYSRRDYDEMAVYAVQAVLCALPFLGLHRAGRRYHWKALLLVTPLVAIFPLFFLGYDWGRWIQMAFFPLGLTACAGVATGVIKYQRVMPPWLALLYIGSWSISHAHGNILLLGLFVWPVLAGLTAITVWFGRKQRDVVNA